MEKRVLSGSSEDHRWPSPINPNQPQKQKPAKKTSVDIVKIVRDENAALRIKLETVIETNKSIVEMNKSLVEENKALAVKIDQPKESVEKPVEKPVEKKAPVVKRVIKKKNPLPRKNTFKV